MRKLMIISALCLAAIAIPNQPAKAKMVRPNDSNCTAALIAYTAAETAYIDCLSTNNNCTTLLTKVRKAEQNITLACTGSY